MHHSGAHSVGVIGGADGPTAIFVSGGGLPTTLLMLGAVALGVVIIAAAIHAARK